MNSTLSATGIDRAALAARAAASRWRPAWRPWPQPPARIAELLRGSVFLNPLRLQGFQTTLLEAVAAGAAVVSTPVGAARYLLEAGADVRLAEASDSGAWTDNVRAALDSPAAPPTAALVDSSTGNDARPSISPSSTLCGNPEDGTAALPWFLTAGAAGSAMVPVSALLLFSTADYGAFSVPYLLFALGWSMALSAVSTHGPRPHTGTGPR